MRFELRPRKSVRRQLGRVAAGQLAASREELTAKARPSDEAIHDARKRVKKTRAVLLLIEADHGRGVGKSGKRLRSVNRALSCLRDADAMIETLKKLREHAPELFSEHGYARLQRELKETRHAVARAAAHDGTWKTAGRAIGKLEKSAHRWRTAHDGIAALERGIRKTHRRARKALTRARATNAAADFHEWRKALKALWYALRLVGTGSPAIARDTRALHSAETWLGDDHNFVVLCARLGRDVSVCRTLLDVRRLQCAVDAIQRELRRKAIARTRRLLAMRPRAYVRRVEHAWNVRKNAAVRRRRAA